MSKKPLAQLVSELQGKSMTYGWDALTLYDQRKANELLFQLYVNRFEKDDYIEPLTTTLSWGEGDYQEHLYNLKLSAPWLSFEKSDPSLPATARLTMDMIGGMLVSTKDSTGGTRAVSKIRQVLPIGGPQLWMDQPLTKASISGLQEVLIDLNNADNFRANFVVGELDQQAVGERFKAYFEANLTAEQKRFSLGGLSDSSNGVLTPKNFEIRTMASDPLASRSAGNYGDGAVMLFITLRDGQDSTLFPAVNSTYLLPDDDQGRQYTGALYLSSRVLFQTVLRDKLAADIGNGLSFPDYAGTQGAAWHLQAKAGGINCPIYLEYPIPDRDSWKGIFTSQVNPMFYSDAGGAALILKPTENTISFLWEKSYSVPFHRPIDVPVWWDEHDDGTMVFSFKYGMKFKVVVDEGTDVVSFERDTPSIEFSTAVSSSTWLPDMGNVGNAIGEQLGDYLEPKIRDSLTHLSPPSIDTFLLRNLLFPGNNALQLTDAFVPGDLAVFGQIDPPRTTALLSPADSVVEAGSGFQFTLTPMPENVRWSARDVDGQAVREDVISPSGYFRAPPPSELPNGFAAIVVTAEGALDGKTVQSSALVSVLRSAIVVNPMYESCDPGQTKELFAQALGDEELEWKILTTQWGSRLDMHPEDSRKRIYTAGGSEDPTVPFSLDIIEVTHTANGIVTSANITLLIHNQAAGAPMFVTQESDPATGTVQFIMIGRNGVIGPDVVIWTLLHGEGDFVIRNATYTEPAVFAPDSFIVVTGTVPGDLFDTHAVAVLPLPLAKYRDLLNY
jgi:hypothetical protein